MIFYRTVDRRFADIGLIKVVENDYCVGYERKTRYGYTQCVVLQHKASGYHLIQSYEKKINNDGFNNMVGLSMYEMKLCLKKMKQRGWKLKKGCVSIDD